MNKQEHSGTNERGKASEAAGNDLDMDSLENISGGTNPFQDLPTVPNKPIEDPIRPLL